MYLEEDEKGHIKGLNKLCKLTVYSHRKEGT